MSNVFRLHDMSVREQLDATALTRSLLDRVEWRERDLKPVIQPEVTPVTDSFLLKNDVLLYHCGAPYQPDWNVKAWIWRYSLSLTLLSRDPERAFRTCTYLNRSIAAWPYEPAVEGVGKVGRIVDNPGFQSVASGDITSSKSVTAWTSTKLVQAASPRD